MGVCPPPTREIFYRYAPVKVIKAYDCLTQSEIAIKQIKRPFDNEVNAVRSFREVHVLARLDHENCISMIYAYTDDSAEANRAHPKTFYLVMPAFGAPLSDVMNKNKLTDKYVQWITFQLISAIQYLHSLNLIHRDIKPENILINEDCHLKLIDFGLARLCSSESIMTGYVVTRYYRAPEIITNWQRYSAFKNVFVKIENYGRILEILKVFEIFVGFLGICPPPPNLFCPLSHREF